MSFIFIHLRGNTLQVPICTWKSVHEQVLKVKCNPFSYIHGVHFQPSWNHFLWQMKSWTFDFQKCGLLTSGLQVWSSSFFFSLFFKCPLLPTLKHKCEFHEVYLTGDRSGKTYQLLLLWCQLDNEGDYNQSSTVHHHETCMHCEYCI